MKSFLEKIRPAILSRVQNIDVKKFQDECFSESSSSKFLEIFEGHKPAIISEIKFSSPSEGVLYEGDLDHIGIATDYLENGSSALSILTEPQFFNGDIQYVRDIRHIYPGSLILLKDFILHVAQLIQAKAYCANSVLLIAAILSDDELHDLYKFSLDLGLVPLIEVHTKEEIARVLPLKPKLIGINNRNLDSFTIDLQTSRDLIKEIPNDIYVISESGIMNAEQINEMHALGFDGFLIGTTLMKTARPGITLSKLISEVNDEN